MLRRQKVRPKLERLKLQVFLVEAQRSVGKLARDVVVLGNGRILLANDAANILFSS